MQRGLRSFLFTGFFLSSSFVLGACQGETANTSLSGAGDSESGTDTLTTTGIDSMGATTDSGSGTSEGSDSMNSDATSMTTAAPTTDGTTGGTDSGTDSSGDTDTDTDTGGPIGTNPCMTDADCDDMLYCTGEETCVNNECQAGTPIACDDGVGCTVDACDEQTQACIAAASDALCDNGLFCDGQETCDIDDGCQQGTPVVCDDNVACTVDSCDETADACSFVPNDTPCDNGTYCDGAEYCDSVLGCQSADPVDCNDLVACTDDSCNEGTDQCDNVPNNGLCDNGQTCDGDETCDGLMGCMPGTPVMCMDDGIMCTVEACDENTDQCETTLDSTLCPGSQFCTDGGCVSGTQCSSDAECDNGLACDGVETCNMNTVPGVCEPGTPVNCNDGVACTLDSCNEPTGTCTNAPQNSACDDNNACNGDETCDPMNGCQAGTAPDCDDGVDCTVDQCFAAFGCFSSASDALCQDDSVCNGAETCDETLGCQAAAGPLQCPSDGIACTNDVCSETFGGCINVPDDTQCACGETCDTTLGCDATCNVATCDGKIYECGDCEDNDNDCTIDDNDLDCFGVCDNNESGFKGEIPGQNSAPCKMDCYFDNDSGSGNDDCYWSHECDMLEPSLVSNNCVYSANANIPGTNQSCAELQMTQSDTCLNICGPVVPNGCDCFGCCQVDTANGTRTVFLGTEDDANNGTCSLDVVDDPVLCRECTQVDACLNPCGQCEICFGQNQLPPECTVQECGELQPCGQAGQDPCPPGDFCLTGCCTSF